MSRRPTPLPPSLGAVFTTEQARAAGVTPRRMRARDIEHPHRGLLVVRPADAESLLTTAEAAGDPFARDRAQRLEMRRRVELYRPLMVAHAFFVGRTAAGFWQLPVDCSGDLEVGVMAPNRAPRRAGIAGRQVAPMLASLRTVDGIAVTSPASTWAMLAPDLSVRELVQVADVLVRIPRDRFARRRPDLALCTVEQLHAAIDAGRRNGVARLREAIESVRVGSASPLESDYRLDAASAIEGDHHRTSHEQWSRDIEKYAAYTAEGYEVVRLTSAHIRGARPTAAERVRAALIRHGWRP